ncbi:MAG: peptide chain release factor N(5)-glutamine methyltransferase [Thermodesulfobacteriota bacterium]
MPKGTFRYSPAFELYKAGVARLREAGITDSEIEASILLCHLLQISRPELFVYRQDLSDSLVSSYHELLGRRSTREPLAYIIGEWEFWSLPFSVSPDVLIPRPETEVLMEHVLKVFHYKAENHKQSFRILDMGAGSGVLSIVLARELATALIYSLDIDPGALKVARQNAVYHNVLERIFFLNADWLQAIRPEPLFDLVVANPPYVAGDTFTTLQPEVRDFEPRLALDGGERGLVEIKRFAPNLALILKPGGYFFMEIGAEQRDEVMAIFSRLESLRDLAVFNDYSGFSRIFKARKDSTDT